MRRTLGMLIVMLAVALGAARAGSPPKPLSTLTIVNYDLQGRKGPLPAAQYEQLQSLLVYLSPDVIAVHNVLVEAGGDESKPLVKVARALEMYYAYQPLDDKRGSALLTRYPLRNPICLFDQKAQATLGMQLTMQVGARSYDLLVVRPPTAAASRSATAGVLQQTKTLAGSDFIVLASFSPGVGAKASLAAWKQAGMFDALARAPKPGPATYPMAKPKERLDLILLSASLRADQVGQGEVLQNPRLAGLSEHLPVQIRLRQVPGAKPAASPPRAPASRKPSLAPRKPTRRME